MKNPITIVRLSVLVQALVLGYLPGAPVAAAEPDNQRLVSPDFRQLFFDAKNLHDATALNLGVEMSGNDLIIGDTPGEVLVITGVQDIQGDLQIVGDGRVELTPTGTMRIRGDILLAGEGVLQGIGGRIEFFQTYSYESRILVWEQSLVQLDGTVIDGNGYPFSMATISNVIWNEVEIINGFATWGIFAGGNVVLADVTNAGEFVQLDVSSLTLLRCHTVLFWLTMPDGSVVDTALPLPGDVALFEINAQTSWATGIPYTVRIEDCTNSMWALMARDGSDSTIRNSRLRVVGSIFESSDTIEIVGLANGMTMADANFVWGGVRHRFVNSTVQTWNLYAWQQTNLTMHTSVFGEIFSEDQAVVTITQSICDGTGGHIETNGQGQMYFFQSLCLTQLTTNDNSVFVAVDSLFTSSTIDATGDSIIAFYDTSTSGDPRAHGAATIFDIAIDPLEVTQGDIAFIFGSARMIQGPMSPIDFISYNVEFLDGTDWNLIDGPATLPVSRGVLAEWDTATVAPGEYAIRVSMACSGGLEPIQTQAVATITAPQCLADLNADGILDFFDITIFLGAFSANDPVADMNEDGAFDFFDVAAYLEAFSAGCP